jgi:hypothetical protein
MEMTMKTKRRTTTTHTVANALSSRLAAAADDEPDPLSDGVNVVIQEAPLFESTRYGADGGGHRLPQERARAPGLVTGRPTFWRDRCTIVLTRVARDPGGALRRPGRDARQYIVATEKSQESRYAVE